MRSVTCQKLIANTGLFITIGITSDLKKKWKSKYKRKENPCKKVPNLW